MPVVDRVATAHLRDLARLLFGEFSDRRLEWDALLPLARYYGLAPLLAFHLRRGYDLDSVPDEVQVALRPDYYAALGRYLRVEHQLAQLLEALAAAQVPTMVVKGLAIAAAYPHPAVRAFDDLDIWVLRDDLDRADEALTGLGYRFVTPRQEPLLHHHLPQMRDSRGGIPLEVHWRLDDGQRVGRLPQQDLWARATDWSVDGEPCLRLEKIDAVLHLCRHAVVQNLLHRGVESLFDLAYLSADWGPAEWATLGQRAVAYGLGGTVYLMLSLQEELLGLAVLPEVLQSVGPAGGTRLPSGLFDRLLPLEGQPGLPLPSTTTRAWSRGSLPARLGYLLRRVFLPPDAMAAQCQVPAGSPRVWLMYLLRPFRLLRQYGPAMWQAFRGDPGIRSAWEVDLWLQQWLREEDGRALRQKVERSG